MVSFNVQNLYLSISFCTTIVLANVISLTTITSTLESETTVEEIDIKMPSSFPISGFFNPSIHEWHKEEGDRIAPGDQLVSLGRGRSEIYFDFEGENLVFNGCLGKSEYEMDVAVSLTLPKGIIVKLCKEIGEEVKPGDVLCKIQIGNCTSK